MLNTILDTWDASLNNRGDVPCSPGLTFQEERQEIHPRINKSQSVFLKEAVM